MSVTRKKSPLFTTVTEMLIETIKRYPILYDTQHKEYKNTREREKIFEKIGRKIGEDGERIKNKWKNLRDSYMKHLKCHSQPGENVKRSYTNWPWARQMEFYHPYITKTKIIKNGDDPETDAETSDSINEIKTEIDKDSEKDTKTPEKFLPKLMFPSTHVENTGQIAVTTKRKRNDYANSKCDHVRSKKRCVKDLTGVELIFRGYAQILKQFSPRRQAFVKLEIANIMTQQELEHQEEQLLHLEDPEDPLLLSTSSSSSHSDTSAGSPANTCSPIIVDCRSIKDIT